MVEDTETKVILTKTDSGSSILWTRLGVDKYMKDNFVKEYINCEER